MAYNIGLDVSFANMWGWKEIREKANKVRKLLQIMMRLPFEMLIGVTPVCMIYTSFP
jgi:hypothetical protein